jgi:predicted dehydrogenase
MPHPKRSSARTTRRSFQKSIALSGAGFFLGLPGRRLAQTEDSAGGTGRRYRACIIGHTGRGDYGHGIDLCFKGIPSVQVTAVADPVVEACAKTAQRVGAEHTYADWRAMLEKEKPDLVAIGPRWVEQRVEMISAAAAGGAHVYMEKPLAASVADADAIVDALRRAKKLLSLAFHARLAPTVLHLKKLVEDGLLGDLLAVETRGKEDRRSGGEDLAVLGTHCLYLLRFFAGQPLWCTARVLVDGRDATRSDAREATEPLGLVAGDTIHATYAFAGGVQGTFSSQKLKVGPGGRFECRLLGSKGQAVIHIGMEPEVHYLLDPSWSPGKSHASWQPLPGVPPARDASGLEGQDACNRRLVLDLLQAAETGKEPVASAEEGRAVLEMIHAVYWAHLSGARAALPLADRRHPLAPPA